MTGMKGSMPWFKLYAEARTDAKLRSLTDEEFRLWFNLLCYASEQPERGVIRDYDEELLALECNALPALLRVTLVTLSKLRIVSCTESSVTFCAFSRRQEMKPSDAPERIKARVAKHRAKVKSGDVTPVKRDVTPVTPREEKERDIEDSNSSVSPSGESSFNVEDVRDAPQKTTTTTSTAWNEKVLQQTADRARDILHLPPRDVSNLKITLAQFPCAPPYLEGEAASCADWCAQHQKRATVAGFNRWLHRSERERLTPSPNAATESSNHREQSAQQQQPAPKPKSDADILYEFHRSNTPPKLVS